MLIYPKGAIPIRRGKHARELQIGDTIRWRYGDADVVVGLAPGPTGQTVACQLRDPATDSVQTIVFPSDRLVTIG